MVSDVVEEVRGELFEADAVARYQQGLQALDDDRSVSFHGGGVGRGIADDGDEVDNCSFFFP